MLHILFSILISLGAVNISLVQDTNKVQKQDLQKTEATILADIDEDVGTW